MNNLFKILNISNQNILRKKGKGKYTLLSIGQEIASPLQNKLRLNVLFSHQQLYDPNLIWIF